MLTNFAAILAGTTASTLTSPGLTTLNYTTLTLTFQHTYKPSPSNPVANVEVSTNGGASWVSVKSYPAVAIGAMNNFVNETIILPAAYNNQANFKFRFNYSASIPFFGAATSWWAVDNVVLTGVPNTYQYSWTAIPAGASAGLPAGAGTPSIIGNNPITVSPTVTTDYTVTETNFSGCSVTRLVTVTVGGTSAAPTGATASPATICTKWIGKTANWNDGQNWCTGAPPTGIDNVTIPVTPNNPVVSSAIATAHNITIAAGASLTVTGNTLQIKGNITNNGTFTATNGTIEFNGPAAQNVAAATFATNTIKDLVISNTVGVTLGGTLNIIINLWRCEWHFEYRWISYSKIFSYRNRMGRGYDKPYH